MMSFYGLLIASIFLLCMLDMRGIIDASAYLNLIHLAYVHAFAALQPGTWQG